MGMRVLMRLSRVSSSFDGLLVVWEMVKRGKGVGGCRNESFK